MVEQDGSLKSPRPRRIVSKRIIDGLTYAADKTLVSAQRPTFESKYHKRILGAEGPIKLKGEVIHVSQIPRG